MSKTGKNKLAPKVVHALMDRGMIISKNSKDHCRDFRIMESQMHKKILILRWTTIDISDADRPKQCYRYECFDMDGTPQNCSIHYSDQEEANIFFQGLKTLYKQDYSIDHTL